MYRHEIMSCDQPFEPVHVEPGEERDGMVEYMRGRTHEGVDERVRRRGAAAIAAAPAAGTPRAVCEAVSAMSDAEPAVKTARRSRRRRREPAPESNAEANAEASPPAGQGLAIAQRAEHPPARPPASSRLRELVAGLRQTRSPRVWLRMSTAVATWRRPSL